MLYYEIMNKLASLAIFCMT